MEPEIARRCGVCGAAVRGTARFCPQCGQSMADARDAEARGRGLAQPALVEEAERIASSLSGRLAARRAGDAADADARTRAPAQAQPTDEAHDGAQSPVAPAPPAQPSATQAPAGADTSVEIRPASAQAADNAAAARGEPRKVQTERDGEAGGARQRAAAAAGDALRPRVGKLRERSVVVLDEAADDPGLRFVLVALALFVVAFLLYVFSFVLR